MRASCALPRTKVRLVGAFIAGVGLVVAGSGGDNPVSTVSVDQETAVRVRGMPLVA
jgi:hypothetical protein